VLAIEHETAQSLLTQARRLAAHGTAAPVVLTAQDLRAPLRQIIVDEWFDLHVLSYAELTPTQRVRSIGMIAADDGQSSKKASSMSMGSDGHAPSDCISSTSR
jgi:type III secretion protein V